MTCSLSPQDVGLLEIPAELAALLQVAEGEKSSLFLHCFISLFISLFPSSVLCMCLFYLLSVTWVAFDLLSLQRKYDKDKRYCVCCFPRWQSGKVTWASGQHTRLKFSIFVIFSALSLNFADVTGDNDVTKLFDQSCVTAKMFNEHRFLAELDIWGVRSQTHLASSPKSLKKLKVKKSKLEFWLFQRNIHFFNCKSLLQKSIF